MKPLRPSNASYRTGGGQSPNAGFRSMASAPQIGRRATASIPIAVSNRSSLKSTSHQDHVAKAVSQIQRQPNSSSCCWRKPRRHAQRIDDPKQFALVTRSAVRRERLARQLGLDMPLGSRRQLLDELGQAAAIVPGQAVELVLTEAPRASVICPAPLRSIVKPATFVSTHLAFCRADICASAAQRSHLLVGEALRSPCLRYSAAVTPSRS